MKISLVAPQRIKALLASDKVRHIDMLRLVMLYALRYESHSNNDVSGLVDVLKHKGLSPEHRAVSREFCLLHMCPSLRESGI